MRQRDLRDLSYDELVEYFSRVQERSYRATQVFEWVYKKGTQNIRNMTNLSAPLRDRLQKDFFPPEPPPVKKETASDRTKKFLFNLKDNEKIETVLIPSPKRTTVCVSTQAGCKFGCRFCASGIGGWMRNLSCSEILGQILYAQKSAGRVPVTHIVFMGVGEPLDNYDSLMKAIRIINSSKGMNIAARRITISTCGLIPKIKQLAQEGLQLELAVSLHGYNNESRNVLMPVNKKYPLSDLIAACKDYVKATKRQITFEYILIQDLTCTEEAARALGKLLKGLLCKINLIPYNTVAEFDHQPPTKTEMVAFKSRLSELGVHATVRTPRGRDIGGACGQLRHTS